MADDDAGAPEGPPTSDADQTDEAAESAVEPGGRDAPGQASEAADKTDEAADRPDEAADKPRKLGKSRKRDKPDKPGLSERMRSMSTVQMALVIGLVLVVALTGLVAWVGFRAYESQQNEARRELFLQVGRQGALNLTTISHERAEADVQRVLDSATGTFYDDFERRAKPFIQVVKQAQSTSEGTVTEAGLESASENEGQVLVAVRVETSNAGAPEQAPRAWRMRLTVEKTGDDEAKVSNVEFVP